MILDGDNHVLEGRCRRCGWHVIVCRAEREFARASLVVLIANHLRSKHRVDRVDAELAARLGAEVSARAERVPRPQHAAGEGRSRVRGESSCTNGARINRRYSRAR